MVKINDAMFGLTKQYFSRGPNGFTSAIVTGERRVGKSVFCLEIVYQICRYEGMSSDLAWDTALNSIIFTMKDFVDIVSKHNYKNRRKFIIWDDSGVYASGLLYQYNILDVMKLKALMDTIGTRCRLLLLTCPDQEGLMKFLRRYQDYLICIEPYHKTFDRNGRLATVLKPYRAKNLSRKWGRAWNDEFNVKIDDDIYNRYIKIRDDYATIVLKELKKRGKRGRKVAEETYGQDNELVRQSELFDDVAPTDSEGSDTPDRGL
jgi:hypothetical protein